MKKIIIISMLLLAAVACFAANPRVYLQWVTLNDGSNPANTPADGATPNPDYIYSVYNSANPTNIIATNTASNPGNVCIKLQTSSGKIIAYLNQSLFAANWPVGSTLYCTVTYIPTNESVTWTREVPSGSLINDNTIPYIIPPTVATTHIISGAITSQWDLTGVTISATDIDPANITYDAGAYTVTVPDGWDGVITPAKAGYIFEPASRTYTDVTADTPNQDFVMKTVVAPGVPANLSPNATTLTYTEPTAVVLTWDAVANAEGYKLIWNNGEIQDLGTALSWTTLPLPAGTYTWKVCAYNNTATKKINTPVRVQMNGRSTSPANSPKADGGWAEASFDVNIVTYDIPDGTPVTPPDATVTVTITITGGNANYGSGVLPGWPNSAFTPVEQYFLDLIGEGPWTITFNTTAPWGAYFLNGIWNAVQNSGVEISFTVTAAKNIEDFPIILGESDPTLPVELSYFAATLTAENFVNIAWTTQTETNMNGFNIYRNDSDNLASAIQIAYIPATNTSTTQNYKHIDREVENGNTYYYWLECVETNGQSTFNGSSPVYVDGPTTPELPNCTTMNNAYPNPFRAGEGTTIKVDVKAGDNGTVTIYNILGQVVKTFPVNQGSNNLTWNARDSKGNLCGNGIYFYKLSTNSRNQTKKMVIVK